MLHLQVTCFKFGVSKYTRICRHWYLCFWLHRIFRHCTLLQMLSMSNYLHIWKEETKAIQTERYRIYGNVVTFLKINALFVSLFVCLFIFVFVLVLFCFVCFVFCFVCLFVCSFVRLFVWLACFVQFYHEFDSFSWKRLKSILVFNCMKQV